jgi:hypothetical protein
MSVSKILAVPAPCFGSAFLTTGAHHASYLRWLQVYKQQCTCKECSGARKHVDLFASHVETMSNFRPPWPFFYMGKNDVEESMKMSKLCRKRTGCEQQLLCEISLAGSRRQKLQA